MGRLAEGTEDGHRCLAMARDLGYLVGEATALQALGIAATSAATLTAPFSWPASSSAWPASPAGLPGATATC
jgi:hypothetical protein